MCFQKLPAHKRRNCSFPRAWLASGCCYHCISLVPRDSPLCLRPQNLNPLCKVQEPPLPRRCCGSPALPACSPREALCLGYKLTWLRSGCGQPALQDVLALNSLSASKIRIPKTERPSLPFSAMTSQCYHPPCPAPALSTDPWSLPSKFYLQGGGCGASGRGVMMFYHSDGHIEGRQWNPLASTTMAPHRCPINCASVQSCRGI